MKYIFLFIIVSILFSCENEKVIQLPEINHSEITEINDVSAAYIFYDETKKDSVELNRKNLISTTNWLINVDKRLTLKQVIPHIKFLQEKKSNSSHKNKKAKNYFTCNDTSRKNLGFIEFTDVVYHEKSSGKYFSETSALKFPKRLNIHFDSLEEINLVLVADDLDFKKSNKSKLKNDIKNILINEKQKIEIILDVNDLISFQDYISFKSVLSELVLEHIIISNNEFISN
jgi:hypothetical protein